MKNMTLDRPVQDSDYRISGQLRVLFIIDSLNLGGAELCLMRLARHLPRTQFQCRVLTFRSTDGSSPLREQFDCPVDYWPLETVLGLSALETGLRLRRLIQKEQIDIVHTFFQTSDLWAGPIAKLSGAKVLISSRRDMGILRKRQHQVGYRLLHNVFDQVQTVSEGVRQWTLRNDRVHPRRTVTIHNGIDTSLSASPSDVRRLRDMLGITSDTPVITTVANLRPIKGIDILIRAAAIVSKRVGGVRFLVAGDGLSPERRPCANELEQLIKSLDVANNVRLLGECRNVPPYWR